MEFEFVKLHGLGNDFVFIDDLSRNIDLTAEQVARICDRHTGIGADGVVLVRPSDDPACAAYMHYINADGTLAQMCGNGARCFAKYLVDRGLVDAADGRFAAGTLSGPKPISFKVDGQGMLDHATVDMGLPVLDPAAVPVAAEANAVSPQGDAYVRELPLASPWGTLAFTCVSMGNPHAVCFVKDFSSLPDELFSDPAAKDLSTFDVERVGSFFEAHRLFPEKANIEFAVVHAEGIALRVYERGCGETMACGTGACAVGVVASLTGRAERESNVNLPGGTLRIRWEDDGHVMMTGPARQSFTGVYSL